MFAAFFAVSPLFLLFRLVFKALFLYAGEEGGGSSPQTFGPQPTADPVSIAVGAGESVNAGIVNFSASELVSGTNGSIDLDDHQSVTIWTNTRASARIVGDLVVEVTGEPKSAATVLFLTGFAAVMPQAPSGKKVPSTLSALSNLPGRVVLNLNAFNTSLPAQLPIPPGVQRELVWEGAIGKMPAIVYAIKAVGFENVRITVHGRLALSGISYPESYYDDAP